MKADEKKEIVVYNGAGDVKLEVLTADDTVWLNRQQLALLFGRDVKTIGKHIDVIHKGTDDSDAGYIGKVLVDILNGHIHALVTKLVVDTDRCFYPHLDGFKGISLIPKGKLFVKYIKLGPYF